MKEIMKELMSVQLKSYQHTTQNSIKEPVAFNNPDPPKMVLPETTSLLKRNQGPNDNDYGMFRSMRAYHTTTPVRNQDKNFFRITRKATSKDQKETEEDEEHLEYPTYDQIINELLQELLQNSCMNSVQDFCRAIMKMARW